VGQLSQHVPVLEGAREGGSAVTMEGVRAGVAGRDPCTGGERILQGWAEQLSLDAECLLRSVLEERNQRGPLGWRGERDGAGGLQSAHHELWAS